MSAGLLILLFAIQGCVACVNTPIGYSKLITARFDSDRGLALGIALTGAGLGTILIPQYAAYLMKMYGWRNGYVGLGLAIVVLAFLPVYLVCHEPAEMKKARLAATSKGASAKDNPALPGTTLSEAIRTPKYWALVFTIYLAMTVTNGTLTHMVPMLTDRGLTIGQAVGMMSVGGLSLIIGRVIAGYLMDKIFAIYVTIFFLLIPMVGVAVLISGAKGVWLVGAVSIMGLCLGAEFDLMPFLVSRYFGIRSFGALYGFVLMFVNFANARGMLLLGWTFQLKRTYIPMLYVFEGFLVITIILMSTMGPYKFPALKRPMGKPAAAGGGD